jgi:hypothetical protein
MASPLKKNAMNFKAIAQADVPHGRNGKHKEIVTMNRLLISLRWRPARAESALAHVAESRAVATASDDTFLYVWNEK